MKDFDKYFKFKRGSIITHKTKNEPFVIINRRLVEGVSGGLVPQYSCENLMYGLRIFWEIEIEKF